MKTSVTPNPSPEEAAAIAAALAVVHSSGDVEDEYEDLKRQRWRLAGLMGGPLPERLGTNGSLWSHADRKRMV